jgi:hypothetical protein
MAAEAKADDVFLTLLKRGSMRKDEMQELSTEQAMAPALFESQPDSQGITKAQFSAAMERLLKDSASMKPDLSRAGPKPLSQRRSTPLTTFKTITFE